MTLPLLAALFGCPSPSTPEVEVVQPEPEPEPPAPALPAPDAPAGPLFLWTPDSLVRVDGTSSTAISGVPEDIERVVIGPDGKAWVVAGRRVGFVVEDRFEPLPAVPSEHALIGVVDVAPQGNNVWAVGPQAIVRFDGTAWTSLAEGARGETTLLSQVRVGPDGTLFSITNKQALVRQGDAWTTTELAELAPGIEFADDLVVLPDGTAWLTFVGDDTRGILVWRDGTWTKSGLKAVFDNDPETLAVGADGGLVGISADTSITRYGLGALSVQSLPDDALAREIDGITVDARNRVWARTTHGLALFAPDGTVTEYARGTNGLPADEAKGIAVVAGGPDLGAAQIVTAPVRGRIERAGSPIANQPLVLCDDAKVFFDDHPCEGATVRHDTRTDDLGAFTFDPVAQGSYVLVIEISGKWTQVLGAGCCLTMTPGQPVDLGLVSLRGDRPE